MITLLIDADILVYRIAARFEHRWEENGEVKKATDQEGAINYLHRYVDSLKNKLGATDTISCLSAKTNWRFNLLADYKGNRKQEKPLLYQTLRNHIMQNMRKCLRPDLEADDILGILATSETIIEGKKIIVSADKDLKTVPCFLYNPDKDHQPKKITPNEAHRFHMLQTLMGDSVDNYKGCPGIGPKKATQYLDEVDPHDYWFAVKQTFECRGFSEKEALLNARIAKILTCTDYDFSAKQVKLWEPDRFARH